MQSHLPMIAMRQWPRQDQTETPIIRYLVKWKHITAGSLWTMFTESARYWVKKMNRRTRDEQKEKPTAEQKNNTQNKSHKMKNK